MQTKDFRFLSLKEARNLFGQNLSELIEISKLVSPVGNTTEAKEYLQIHSRRFWQSLSFIPRFDYPLEVLDIGVGYLSMLIKNIFNYKIYGVDHHEMWKSVLNKYEIPFKRFDFTKENIPYNSESLDMVLLCEVIEHLPIPPTTAFQQIFRVLKRNGLLLLTTPNLARISSRIALLRGETPLEQFFIWDEGSYSHIREYTLKELTYYLKSSGFEVLIGKVLNSWHEKGVVSLLTMLIPSMRDNIFILAKKTSNTSCSDQNR